MYFQHGRQAMSWVTEPDELSHHVSRSCENAIQMSKAEACIETTKKQWQPDVPQVTH